MRRIRIKLSGKWQAMLKLGALHLVIAPLLLVPIAFFLALLVWHPKDGPITLETFVRAVSGTYAFWGVPAAFHGMLVGYITMKKKYYTILDNTFFAIFSTFLFLVLIGTLRWLSMEPSTSMETDIGFAAAFIAFITICLILAASVMKLIFHFEYSEKRSA